MEEGKENGTGETGNGADTANKIYVWISLVEAVSELTKYDFEKVFNMEAIEFFSFVTYCRFKAEKEKRRIEALNKRLIV